MQPEFWHARWGSNQIGFHQDDVNPYLRTFWPCLDVALSRRVFVPLCGKSRDMGWLRVQGHDVVGVELSPVAVEAYFAAQKLVPEVTVQDGLTSYSAGGVQIFCGDFFDLRPEHLAGVGAVYDRAALVALPPDMRSAYVAHMARLIMPETPMLLVAFDYPQHEMAGPPFAVSEAEVQALYGPWCSVSLVQEADILAQETRIRERGVTRLQEKVYLLRYNS